MTDIPSPSLVRRVDTGAVVIRRYCACCGVPWASFGVGVHYADALKLAERKMPYAHLLGTWWCKGPGQCHRAEVTDE